MYDIRNFFAPYIQGPGLSVTIEQGYIQVGGVSLFVPRTIVTLAANATTYIYIDNTGAIVTSNIGFPAGSNYPIAIVVTGTSSVLTLTDSRPDVSGGGGGGTGGIAAAIAGNTQGVLATVSTGTLVLAGGNNITLSQNGQTVTVIGGAGGAGGSFSAGISGGNTSGNTGTVSNQLVLAGGNNITLSGSTNAGGMSVTISGTNQSVQTQGSVLINGSSGSIVLTAGPNISLQQNASTITISASNQSVQTQNCVDLSLSGNTAGALALISSGTAILAGGNNVTLSQNGQSVTISAANQTVQTQNLHDVTLAGNTAGALALISSGTMTLAGGNNVTLSQNGNAVTISAFNQTVQTQNLIDVSLAGNTSGTLALISSGTMILSGGNNITLSQNGQTVEIDAASQTVQTQNCVDVSLAGNTSGALALISSGTMILAGGPNITLSQNGQSVTISAPSPGAATNVVDVTLAGNTTGTLALISSGTMTLAGGNGITLSQNGNAVTISGPPDATHQFFFPSPNVPDLGSSSFSGISSSNQWMWPFSVGGKVSCTQANVFMVLSLSSSSNSSYAGSIFGSIGIYTNNASTLSIASSATASFAFTQTSNSSNSLLSGLRALTFPLNCSFTPGDYWFGIVLNTSTANTGWFTVTIPFAQLSVFGGYSGNLGQVSNLSFAQVPGWGSASVTGFQSSLALTSITGNGNVRVFRVCLYNTTA